MQTAVHEIYRIDIYVPGHAGFPNQGYDHVVLLLAIIKLDYNPTSTSGPSSSGLRGRRRTYLTILKRYGKSFLRPLRPELECQDVDVRWL
jgi:hypothetical protein